MKFSSEEKENCSPQLFSMIEQHFARSDPGDEKLIESLNASPVSWKRKLAGSSSLHNRVCREAIGQQRGGTRYTDNLETSPGLRRAR